MNNLIKLSHI